MIISFFHPMSRDIQSEMSTSIKTQYESTSHPEKIYDTRSSQAEAEAKRAIEEAERAAQVK